MVVKLCLGFFGIETITDLNIVEGTYPCTTIDCNKKESSIYNKKESNIYNLLVP